MSQIVVPYSSIPRRFAPRVNATGQAFTRTTNLPGSAAFTICGFGVQKGDRNTFSVIAGLESGSSSAVNGLYISTEADGTSLRVYSSGSAAYSAEIVQLQLNKPFFWALVVSGTGAAQAVGYYKLLGAGSFLSQTNTGASFTPAYLALLNDSFDEWFDGGVWGVRLYSAALSVSELHAESLTEFPRRLQSLVAAWPLKTQRDIFDVGPFKRNLAVSGSPILNASPYALTPTIYDFSRQIRLPLSVAAGGVTGTLAYTNNNDTLAGSGTSTVKGTLAYSNNNDTLAAAGKSTVIGTLGYTNNNDTLTASGTAGAGNNGTLAYTNNNDTLAGTGAPVVKGTLAATNANDTLAAAGTSTVKGSLAYTNNNDSLAASGKSTVIGTLAASNNNDTLSASGNSGVPPVVTDYWRWIASIQRRIGI
jgi:predicted TIM-barrel enzyme